MLKVKFLNSTLYLLLRYLLFFLVLAFIGDRFQHAVLDKVDSSPEVFKLTGGYVLYVLIASIFLMSLFCFPLYFILRLKSNVLFLLAIACFYTAEYFVYSYLFSRSDHTLGIYNLAIGVVLLFLCFGRSLKRKFA